MITGTLGGHPAELVRVEGERVTVRCPAPFAPGKPTALVLALDPPLELPLKAVGSRKVEDGRFEVIARIVMLRREDRERLDRLRDA